MAPKLESSYPGGPRRSTDQGSATSRRPASTEERHDRRTARHRRRRDRRRYLSRVVVVAIAAATAAGIGYLLGSGAGVDPTGRGEGARGPMTTEEFINSELNRVLLELWKMEELERR